MIDNPGRRDLLLAGSLAVLAGGTLAPLRAEAQPATGPAPAKELRILLLNPNSSPDFTRIIAAEARRVGSPGTEFVEVTSPFGPRYIGSRATVAIASSRSPSSAPTAMMLWASWAIDDASAP